MSKMGRENKKIYNLLWIQKLFPEFFPFYFEAFLIHYAIVTWVSDWQQNSDFIDIQVLDILLITRQKKTKKNYHPP